MAQQNQPIVSYCDYVERLPDGESRARNREYHDKHYGFPIHDDNELFGRFILEINQAGLSWTTILKKQENFRRAYDGFDIARIAAYGAADRERLLSDGGIIRNRRKIDAVIDNAKAIVSLQKEYGSFEEWLERHHPRPKDEWVKLFKSRFRFVGGEIVGEFLISIGYLKGAHKECCPIYAEILKTEPKWRADRPPSERTNG